MSRRRRNETEEQRARRELISDFLSAVNNRSMDDIQELFKEALAGFMEGSLESELDSDSVSKESSDDEDSSELLSVDDDSSVVELDESLEDSSVLLLLSAEPFVLAASSLFKYR